MKMIKVILTTCDNSQMRNPVCTNVFDIPASQALELECTLRESSCIYEIKYLSVPELKTIHSVQDF